MKKIQKTAIIYLVIFVQSALAITAGIFAIYFLSGNKLPAGMKVGKIEIGKVDRQEAESLINRQYEDVFKKGKLQISVKDSDDSFSIPYSDFDAAVDAAATIDSALGAEKDNPSVLGSLKKAFSTGSTMVDPVVVYNESKLRKILIDLSAEMDKEPVNAALYYEAGKIVKKPEQDGQKLNITNAIEKIHGHILSSPAEVLVFNRFSNIGLETVQPELKLRDLDDIDTIITEYDTKLIYPEFTDAIKRASEAVNGIIISSAGAKNSDAGVFSFVEWLKSNDIGFENDNEGYDQVASTLYAAILSAGIDKSAITRLAHEIPVGYIKPGLDAWISGNGGELKFSNTLQHKIVILAEMEEDRIIIRIAGNSEDKKQVVPLKVEVVERFSPPVFNVENKELKKDEKIVLDQGKEGIKVNVYRGTKLISEDRYEAVKKIVQIGPDTDWSSTEEDK